MNKLVEVQELIKITVAQEVTTVAQEAVVQTAELIIAKDVINY